MADFQTAFKLLLKQEGGYSNDPTDRGGETYQGISRVHNPDWRGWAILADKANLKKNGLVLATLVETFYRGRYWDPVKCDLMPQYVANRMLDIAVNMGVGRAGRILQEALNLLNRNGASWADLTVDGDIGGKTLEALRYCILKDADDLLAFIKALQAEHYMEVMRTDPSQERFARGWIRRAFA